MIALSLTLLVLLQTPAAPSREASPAPDAAVDSGSARAMAANALSAATRAVAQTVVDAKTKSEASERLSEAENLFLEGRYPESARVADEAWALVSAEAKEATQFRVEVARDGETEVISTSGAPIRVEAQGVTRPVYAGQSLKVRKGEAPPEVEGLKAPAPLRPLSGGLVRAKRRKGSLAPVTLSWTAVPGAENYEVEVQSASGGEPFALTVAKTITALPPLEPGRYVWTVRALRGRERSEASLTRQFELVEEVLKLEVKGSSWK